jgi:hypothetical protein
VTIDLVYLVLNDQTVSGCVVSRNMKHQQIQTSYLGVVFAMRMPVCVVTDVMMICTVNDVSGAILNKIKMIHDL